MLGRPVEPFGPELSAPEDGAAPERLPDIAQTERERIVGALGPCPVDIDEVARATGIAVRKVHIVLLELDLAGKLQRHGQQLVSLIEPERVEAQASFFPRAFPVLFLGHGKKIGNQRQSCGLDDRFQFLEQGRNVVRGLAPRHIGPVCR